MVGELPVDGERRDRAWRFRLGPIPLVVRPAAGLLAGWMAVTLFISGPPTFRYAPVWSLIGGILFVVFVVLHEMGHAVARLATGSRLLKVEILGMGGVTSSTGRVSRRQDVICTLSGLIVTGSLAATAALFTLHPSPVIRDPALVIFLANIVTLFENLVPMPGNDSAVLLELGNSKESVSDSEVRRRTAIHARVMVLTVCGVAAAAVWTSVGSSVFRIASTVLILGFGGFAWTQWRGQPSADPS